MTKIHILDNYTNEILKYDSENEIEYLKIKNYTNLDENEDNYRGVKPLIKVELENGTVINYMNDDSECFRDDKGIAYAPVYDVETCEIEGYSMYLEDDIIGFVSRGY